MSDPTAPPLGDEDCLYLNIWASDRCMTAGGCATMLWLHGGGYTIGSGINYDGAKAVALAKDVIVATTNYRLSAFGFAAVPVGAGESTGNFGLQDQRLAMRWLRLNIRSFGGNGRVTIVGESAGATSVTCQLCMPASRGLFDGAAMESGAFAYWAALPMVGAKHQFDLLLRETACADMDCLRTLDARTLTTIANNFTVFANTTGKRYATSWAPTVDGVELLALPSESLASGRCAQLPLLLGVNRDEGTLAVGAPGEVLLRKGYNMTADDLTAFLTKWLAGNATRVREASALYAVGSSPLLENPYWAATHFLGDMLFTCPALRAARVYAGARAATAELQTTPAPVFSYFFDHVPRNPPFRGVGAPGFKGSAGVSHAFEMQARALEHLPRARALLHACRRPRDRLVTAHCIPLTARRTARGATALWQFVWQGLPHSWAPYGTLVGPDEVLLARTMAAYWTNFARGGDPNLGVSTSLTINWPRAAADGRSGAPFGRRDADGRMPLQALQLDLPALSPVTARAAPQCEFIDAIGPIPAPWTALLGASKAW